MDRARKERYRKRERDRQKERAGVAAWHLHSAYLAGQSMSQLRADSHRSLLG